MIDNRIILPITPKPNIRTTQGTEVLFRIPEECPHNCGLPRKSIKQPLIKVSDIEEKYPELWSALGGKNWVQRKKRTTIRYGCPHCLGAEQLYIKKYIEKYNEYKAIVAAMCKKKHFTLPDYGWKAYFYFPMPKKWSPSDRLLMHGQKHERKPDRNNCIKGLEDSLRYDDEKISQNSGEGKFWFLHDLLPRKIKKIVPEGSGYIEIFTNQPVYNPFGVPFIDQSQVKSLHQTSNYKKRLQEGGNIRSYKRKPKEDKIK